MFVLLKMCIESTTQAHSLLQQFPISCVRLLGEHGWLNIGLSNTFLVLSVAACMANIPAAFSAVCTNDAPINHTFRQTVEAIDPKSHRGLIPNPDSRYNLHLLHWGPSHRSFYLLTRTLSSNYWRGDYNRHNSYQTIHFDGIWTVLVTSLTLIKA